MRRSAWPAALLVVTSCVYFNAMYDTNRAYDLAVDSRREGRLTEARAHFDSVIAKAARLIEEHPASKYAAPAALLKARSEIARKAWQEARSTAAGVVRLTDDPVLLGTAAGLEGTALRRLGDAGEAERLLSQALDTELSDEDRATFLFQRGLARLALEDGPGAARDLEAASTQKGLTAETRLDLARGLSDVGQYEAAVRLTAELVKEDRFASFGPGMSAHLDSLVLRDPGGIDAAFGELLGGSDLSATKTALLHYYRGRASEFTGDPEAALAQYDSARLGADRGRYGAMASYRAARLRIAEAERPSDILATRPALARARGLIDPEMAGTVDELRMRVEELANLVEAYQNRGSTAAEAALRAAEIAGIGLHAPRVARGLYLRYLELAPGSPWEAKAIAGALQYSSTPAGEWAGDLGARTDARLAERLAGLPRNDPYRISIQDLPRDAQVDSAYVLAERNLRRRLVQIRMLYDTTAAFVTPADTAGEEEQDTVRESEPAVQDGDGVPRVEP